MSEKNPTRREYDDARDFIARNSDGKRVASMDQEELDELRAAEKIKEIFEEMHPTPTKAPAKKAPSASYGFRAAASMASRGRA